MTQKETTKRMNDADTLYRAIGRLKAYHECNHEVMDADDTGELLTTIQRLTTMRNELLDTKSQIREVYAEADDTTFIMEDTYAGDDLKSIECIGWYCGEPNKKDTIYYATRDMIAIY